MTDHLPEAPTSGRRGLPSVPPAGPCWRIWHPSAHVRRGDVPRRFGPLARFDPHPAGPPAEHPGTFVLYGSLAFEVSALEVFHRSPSPAAVDVCPSWRATLISTLGTSRLFDLTDRDAAASIGATPRLGDTDLDHVGYRRPQGWARFLHASPGIDGVRYPSCRARDRGGVTQAVWRRRAIGRAHTQHLLVDDAIWPYLVLTLDSVGVAVNRVASCPRC